jgi:ATP-dependent DNA ligase
VRALLQVFDCLYMNGKSLLKNTLAERRAILHKVSQ